MRVRGERCLAGVVHGLPGARGDAGYDAALAAALGELSPEQLEEACDAAGVPCGALAREAALSALAAAVSSGRVAAAASPSGGAPPGLPAIAERVGALVRERARLLLRLHACSGGGGGGVDGETHNRIGLEGVVPEVVLVLTCAALDVGAVTAALEARAVRAAGKVLALRVLNEALGATVHMHVRRELLDGLGAALRGSSVEVASVGGASGGGVADVSGWGDSVFSCVDGCGGAAEGALVRESTRLLRHLVLFVAAPTAGSTELGGAGEALLSEGSSPGAAAVGVRLSAIDALSAAHRVSEAGELAAANVVPVLQVRAQGDMHSRLQARMHIRIRRSRMAICVCVCGHVCACLNARTHGDMPSRMRVCVHPNAARRAGRVRGRRGRAGRAGRGRV